MATIENHLTQLRRRMEAIKLRAMTSEGVAKERESVLEELKADVEQRRKALLEEVLNSLHMDYNYSLQQLDLHGTLFSATLEQKLTQISNRGRAAGC